MQNSKQSKGPSINDVSSKGEGQNVGIYLVKRRQRGREGGHKIGKMGRRRLWMAPYVNICQDIRDNKLYYDELNNTAKQGERYIGSETK